MIKTQHPTFVEARCAEARADFSPRSESDRCSKPRVLQTQDVQHLVCLCRQARQPATPQFPPSTKYFKSVLAFEQNTPNAVGRQLLPPSTSAHLEATLLAFLNLDQFILINLLPSGCKSLTHLPPPRRGREGEGKQYYQYVIIR